MQPEHARKLRQSSGQHQTPQRQRNHTADGQEQDYHAQSRGSPAVRAQSLRTGVVGAVKLFAVGAATAGQPLAHVAGGRLEVLGLSWAAAMDLVLSFALIPSLGMRGAAWATALSMVAWNLILARRVRRDLGVRALPRGFGAAAKP